MDAGWLVQVVARVDARLADFFAAQRIRARATSPEASELVDAVAELTLRGGKRLRPAALHAASLAIDASFDAQRSVDACAALELLQSYFLIQDDWMDGDDERRGGPAVHAALSRSRNDARLGVQLAILAADVASGFAWELIASAPFPSARLPEALAAFGQMHFEVVCGQQLDLLGHENVSLVHDLKTGSYTVRGPLCLGALLADASREQLVTLERFGAPLGLAFQLRDDLLSAFGAAREIGKPVGNDLRAGKRTALIAEARTLLSPGDRAALEAVFGHADASDEALAKVTESLERSGVRERAEERVTTLLADAARALDSAALSERGRALLFDLAQKLSLRQR